LRCKIAFVEATTAITDKPDYQTLLLVDERSLQGYLSTLLFHPHCAHITGKHSITPNSIQVLEITRMEHSKGRLSLPDYHIMTPSRQHFVLVDTSMMGNSMSIVLGLMVAWRQNDIGPKNFLRQILTTRYVSNALKPLFVYR
jgi:hypothetical protein